MRSCILLLLPCSLAPCTAQDLVLKPEWRKGDVRSLYITTSTRSFEDGPPLGETNERMDARVKVFNVEPGRWVLEVDMPDPVLRTAQGLSEKLGGPDLDPCRRLQPRFTVARADGEMVLLNGADLRAKVNRCLDQIRRTLRAQDPTVLDTVERAVAAWVELFADSSAIAASLTGDFAFLARAVGRPLHLDKALAVHDTILNPFDPKGPKLVLQEQLHLDGLDRETGKATLRIVQRVDEAAFKANVRQALLKTVEAKGTDRAARNRAMAEVEKTVQALKLEVEATETHELDTAKGWPLRVTRTSRALMVADGRERLVVSQRSVEVR
jgi:hypothetical protein